MLGHALSVVAMTAAVGIVGTSPTYAVEPDLTIVGASLLAKGAALTVDLAVTCDDMNPDYPGYPDASLEVTVRQVQKKSVVMATAYGQVTCDGSTLRTPVTVSGYNLRFTKGVALVTATMTTYQTFQQTIAQREVRPR